MRKLLTILFLFCSLMLSGQGSYWIAPYPAGNDITGDGSYNTPWATLPYAATQATTAGDIIHVKAGIYITTTQTALSAKVSIEGVGNTSIIRSQIPSAATIRLYSPADGTDGNQTISYIRMEGSSLTADRAIDVIGRKNVRIHHCEFVNFLSTGIIFKGNNVPPSTYLTGNEFYNNIVTNCAKYIVGQQGWGNLRIGSQEGMLIYNNVITQPNRGVGLNGYGIKFDSDGYCKGLKIYNNNITIHPLNKTNEFDFALELFHCQGGIEIYNNTIQGTLDFSSKGIYPTCNDIGGYGYAIKIYGNTIRQNTITSEQSYGVDLERDIYGGVYIFNNLFENLTFPIATSVISPDHQEDIYIYYNIIKNCGMSGLSYAYGGGIRLGHSSSGNTYDNFNVWNNVIYGGSGARPADGIRLNFVGSATNISVKNNIIIGFENYSIQVLNSTINGLAINKNIAYGNGNNNINYSGGSITNNTSTANIISDPLFKGGTPYSFELKEGSPAIGAGIDVGLLYDYNEMMVESPPEIGAYEYQGVPPLTVPTVTTTAITDITASTATGGGNVTDDGGAAVTVRGVCWSTTSNPTTANSYTTNGSGTGVFVSSLVNLEAGFTYYVRAYATNSVGTAYGNQRSFTASATPPPPPVDILVKSGGQLVKIGTQLIKIE